MTDQASAPFAARKHGWRSRPRRSPTWVRRACRSTSKSSTTRAAPYCSAVNQVRLRINACSFGSERPCFQGLWCSCCRDMPAVAGQGHRPPVQCASAGTGCLRVLASGQLETIWAIVILLSHSHDIFLIHLLSLNAITDQAQVRRPEWCTGWGWYLVSPSYCRSNTVNTFVLYGTLCRWSRIQYAWLGGSAFIFFPCNWLVGVRITTLRL